MPECCQCCQDSEKILQRTLAEQIPKMREAIESINVSEVLNRFRNRRYAAFFAKERATHATP